MRRGFMNWEQLLIFKRSGFCAWTAVTAITSIIYNWEWASSSATLSKLRLSAFVKRNLGKLKRLLKREVVCLLIVGVKRE